jgi:thioredoxin-related protein
MKKWLIMLATVAIGAGAFASDGWETDFEKAKTKAKEENKHILVDFSGSDWCGWCIKLDEEVFSERKFKKYAEENLVLVLADFPRDKSDQSDELQKQNKELSEKYGVRGFPTVYILSSDGKTVAKTGYQAGGPEAYVEHIKKLIADAKVAATAK